MSYGQYMALLNLRPGLRITFRCNEDCNLRKPIEEIFFCGHCSRFVCEECSAVEIDTYFCPTCLSSVLSSYAYQDENRCQKCVECPSCFTTLTSVLAPTTQEYTYFCEFCKWNSSSIGLSSNKPAGLFTELKNREAANESKAQFEALQAQYTREFKESKEQREAAQNTEVAVRLMERARSESKTELPGLQRRRSALQAQVDRLDGTLEERARDNYRLPTEDNPNEAIQPAPALVSESKTFNMFEVTNLQQRFNQPGSSPLSVQDALPRRKHLLTKTAHRCRQCKKYVVKPKVGATHVAFDRKTFAITFVPTVTVSRIAELEVNRPTNFVMYFENPVMAEVMLSLEEVKEDAATRTCQVFLPSNFHEVKLYAYDETQEESDAKTERDHYTIFDNSDDPKVVAFRHLNKVGLHLTLNPLASGPDIEFALKVNLRSTNAELSEFEQFSFLIDVNLGPVDGVNAAVSTTGASAAEEKKSSS